MTKHLPLDVRCPDCGSLTHQPCHVLDPITGARTSRVRGRPHPARRRAAEQASR